MLGERRRKSGENSSAIMLPAHFEFMIMTKWPKLHEILMVTAAEVGTDLWNEKSKTLQMAS